MVSHESQISKKILIIIDLDKVKQIIYKRNFFLLAKKAKKFLDIIYTMLENAKILEKI